MLIARAGVELVGLLLVFAAAILCQLLLPPLDALYRLLRRRYARGR